MTLEQIIAIAEKMNPSERVEFFAHLEKTIIRMAD